MKSSTTSGGMRAAGGPAAALTALLSGLLTACQLPPPAPEASAAPPSVVAEPLAVAEAAPQGPAAEPAPPVAQCDELVGLLDYHQRLRSSSTAELAREAARLNGEPPTATRTLRKAMVWSLSRDAADLLLAEQQLSLLETATDPKAERLRPLARLLGAQLAEQRRLGDGLAKLTQQLRDSQRRAEHLGQTLEALKAIEQEVPAAPNRPRPPASAPANGSSRP